MLAGIHMAVERCDFSGTPKFLQGREGRSARVTQNEIELSQSLRWNILNTAARLESRDGDRRVEIIEDAASTDGFVEDEIRRSNCVGTIGSDDDGIGISRAVTCVRLDMLPIGIQAQLCSGQIQA